MSSYSKPEEKIEVSKFTEDNPRIINNADLLAIHVYPHNMYVILKWNFVIPVMDENKNSKIIKSGDVISKESFQNILTISNSPIVLNSSYLNMEPYRNEIMSFYEEKEKQEINKLEMENIAKDSINENK